MNSATHPRLLALKTLIPQEVPIPAAKNQNTVQKMKPNGTEKLEAGVQNLLGVMCLNNNDLKSAKKWFQLSLENDIDNKALENYLKVYNIPNIEALVAGFLLTQNKFLLRSLTLTLKLNKLHYINLQLH